MPPPFLLGCLFRDSICKVRFLQQICFWRDSESMTSLMYFICLISRSHFNFFINWRILGAEWRESYLPEPQTWTIDGKGAWEAPTSGKCSFQLPSTRRDFWGVWHEYNEKKSNQSTVWNLFPFMMSAASLLHLVAFYSFDTQSQGWCLHHMMMLPLLGSHTILFHAPVTPPSFRPLFLLT